MRKIAFSLAVGVIFIIFASQSVSAEKYTVKQGDNLWNISEKHDISVSELIEINELDTVILRPEQELYIYETYKVRSGDTLSEIGQKYSVSVEQLKDWNDLSSDLIVTGEELTIHALHEDLLEKEKAKQKEVKKAAEKAAAQAETKKETEAQAQKEETSKEEKQVSGQTMTVTATAYTAQCDGCSGITYTGVNLNENRHAKVIAVDPNVIPLGSKVYVEGYGEAIAADIGGAIKGQKIDIHVPTKDDAYQWGVRTVDITILD